MIRPRPALAGRDTPLNELAPRLLHALPTSFAAPTFATASLPTPASSQWRATSLFCGGGGIDLGFLQQGVAIDAAYDKSRAALSAYSANLPGQGRLADLARFSPEDPCDVLLAGAPCQGFSTAGKHLHGDPRNALLARVADIALAIMPRIVVVENVPAASSGRHQRLWMALQGRLRLGGYNTATIGLRGEESGLAQRRRRLFMLCWLGHPDTRVDMDAIMSPGLRHVLHGVEELRDHVPCTPSPSSIDAMIARRIGPGQKLCNVRTSASAVPTWSIPEVFGETDEREKEVLSAVRTLRRRERVRNFGDGDPVAPERLDRHLGRDTSGDSDRLVQAGYLRVVDGGLELRHTYNGKYRRLDWRDQSPTVDTHFDRMSLFVHPDAHRGLSAREAARIQGFPDAYKLPTGARDRLEVIGNAVPPPMAARIAAFLREALLKR